MATPEFHGSKARLGIHDALRELTDIYLVEKHQNHFFKPTHLLLSRETQQTMLSRLRWLPVRLDAYDGVPPEIAPYFEAVREAMARAEARPTDPQWTLAENVLDGAFGGLIRGDEDIDSLSLEEWSASLEEIPSHYARYTVQPGDTLEMIASRYDTTPAAVAAANRITIGTSIGPGQILLVPRQ